MINVRYLIRGDTSDESHKLSIFYWGIYCVENFGYVR